MTPSKLRRVARLWLLALALSAVPVLAGRRWSEPLPPRGDVVWLLVLLPPLLMAAWLLVNWDVPAPGREGESGEG